MPIKSEYNQCVEETNLFGLETNFQKKIFCYCFIKIERGYFVSQKTKTKMENS